MGTMDQDTCLALGDAHHLVLATLRNLLWIEESHISQRLNRRPALPEGVLSCRLLPMLDLDNMAQELGTEPLALRPLKRREDRLVRLLVKLASSWGVRIGDSMAVMHVKESRVTQWGKWEVRLCLLRRERREPRQLSLSVALNYVPPNPEALPAVCAEAVVDLCRAIACTAARSRLELHRMPNRTVKVALLQALVKALCAR